MTTKTYQLLGPDGRPIAPRRLKKEVATPTLSGVRQVISGHPAEGLTPARLARIHLAAANHDPEAYLELAEDMEERDAHYQAVMGTRLDQQHSANSTDMTPLHLPQAPKDPKKSLPPQHSKTCNNMIKLFH